MDYSYYGFKVGEEWPMPSAQIREAYLQRNRDNSASANSRDKMRRPVGQYDKPRKVDETSSTWSSSNKTQSRTTSRGDREPCLDSLSLQSWMLKRLSWSKREAVDRSVPDKVEERRVVA